MNDEPHQEPLDDAPHLWPAAIAIVRDAVDLPPSDREGLIEARCGDDHRLGGAVRALLLEHDEESVGLWDEIDEQLGIPGGTSSSVLPIVEGVELTGLLGRGGSGDVYAGRQDPPGRDVAVKVLRAGLSSRRAVQRFSREARALAAIDHESVAAIYAVGEAKLPGGSIAPCLVMEFVKGRTLREIEMPLPVAEAAAMIASLARGLHAAHQRGVIHRDLKPSNVIIDEAGRPKIIDFGVAALTSVESHHSVRTMSGELLGTLGYMSPEQLEGTSEVADVRTDVYALGVLFYELVTGEPAIDAKSGSSFAALQSIARGALPRLPIAGDPDVIYRKATAQEPARRYDSAAALADDMDRFAAGRPVLARKPSKLYSTRLFVRRNPVPVSLGAAAGIALLVLALAAGVGFVTASRERDAARLAERRAVQASTFLREMLASPDPDIDGPDVRVVDVLDRSAKLVEELGDADPLVTMDLHRTLGWTYAALSLHDKAVPELERAVDIAGRELGPASDERLLLETNLGDSLVYVARHDDALELMNSVVSRCATSKDVAPETHVAALVGQSEAQRSIGDSQAAADTLMRAIDLAEAELGPSHPQTLAALSGMGRIELDLNRASQAAAIFQRLVDTYASDAHSDPSRRLIAEGNLAMAFAGEGKHEKAIGMYEGVLERGVPVLGNQHHTIRMVRGILPDSYQAVGRLDDALAMSERALRDTVAAHGRGHPDELLAVSNHAVLLMQLERWDEVLPFTRRLADELPAVLGPDHPRTLIGLRNHAAALDFIGRDDEAAEVLYRVLEMQRSSLGDDHFDTLVTKNNLAFLLESIGRGAEGVPLMETVVEVAGGDSGLPAAAIAVFRLNLGRCLLSAGEYERAAGELQRSLELNPDSPGHVEKVNAAIARLNASRQPMP